MHNSSSWAPNGALKLLAFAKRRASLSAKPHLQSIYHSNTQIDTLQGINISHLGKRKIIFKMPFWGDMLVSWRVLHVHHPSKLVQARIQWIFYRKDKSKMGLFNTNLENFPTKKTGKTTKKHSNHIHRQEWFNGHFSGMLFHINHPGGSASNLQFSNRKGSRNVWLMPPFT